MRGVASIADVIAGLKAVLTQVVTARQHLASCGWVEVGARYQAVTTGSTHPDTADLVRLSSAARHWIDQSDQLTTAAETAINAAIAGLQGDTSSAPTSSAPTSHSVRHRDGSRYPDAAAWAVPDLPRRVRQGDPEERTTGRVLVGGRDLQTMTSGRDGTWTPEVRARLGALGIRTTMRLENHVEMKVAQLMIRLGARDGEVVINHAPCGSQRPMRAGCHQVLSRYLPGGYTLTVHGTTQDGRPFTHTYEGQA